MSYWWLYLYLGALGTVNVPGHFDSKEACIEQGKEIIATYKSYHTASAGFFWCVPGGADADGS